MSDPRAILAPLTHRKETKMAVAIALCSTYACTGVTVFEDVPSCFSPKEMPCPSCEVFMSDPYAIVSH